MVKSNRSTQPKSSPAEAAFAWVRTVEPADRRIAFVVGAVALGLLLREVVRGSLPGDSGEFHFAAWRLGLAHPTGYPLYMLAGGLWQHLWALVGIPPSTSLNALSAVFMAVAAGLAFLLLRRWLPGPVSATRLAAGLGAALLVANPTVRSQSLIAEVYSLHLLLIVSILHAATNLLRPVPSRLALPGLALLVGLALTHHATTVLLLPPLLLLLFLGNRRWWRADLRTWLLALALGVAPLLLYLYVPLRAGSDASPWLHQRLGDGVLTLYDGSLPAFLNFVTGRSISVGFLNAAEAAANLPTAALFWLRHFEWPGLVLALLGLWVLLRTRAWPVLALTGSYLLLHQVFNLFYAIGDIFVYYIPIYLVVCIWIAYGAAGIGAALSFGPPPVNDADRGRVETLQRWGTAFVAVLFFLPVQFWARYTPLVAPLQAESDSATAMWDAVLAANPAQHAILVSNDRNEIVPLFYRQYVQDSRPDLTGLFPLIAPDDRFTDLGATVQSALDAGTQPVYLIKPMPGLEARFALAPRTPPLVEVIGPAATAPPAIQAGREYGPLLLLGYDLRTQPGEAEITLHWQVNGALDQPYTTTVQLFDAAGNKLGQDDRPPGGAFYPATLWKPGEVIVDSHTVVLPADATPARLLVGMYAGPDAHLLAPALEIDLP